MNRVARRHAFSAAVLTLVFLIVAVGAFLVTVAGPDLARLTLVAPASPSPTPAPTPATAMALSPVGIAMPEGSDCQGCHTTANGVGTKAIPVMGHPLWGWRDCTACHAPASLVKTAPGHSGLHKDQCLICHQTQADAGVATTPPLRPEHMGTDKPCTACHGVDKHAPLPASMAGRGNNCWICHNGPEYRYLFEDDPSPGPTAGSSG
jgi:hypothetical protein